MPSVTTWLADRLRLPGAPRTGAEAESDSRLQTHRLTLERRPAFRQVALDIQREISDAVDAATSECTGRAILEIGSGVIALSDANNDVLTSDLSFANELDVNLSAYDIPIRSGSLRSVVAQNVFHHLPDYQRALHEMTRVVEPGGVVVLVEPHHGWMARRVFPALFSFEGYDVTAERITDAESLPNQALSYIVFERDLANFETDFPKLSLEATLPMRSGIRYLATGGLNFRQMVPSFALRALRRFEHSRRGVVLQRHFAMHWMIVLRVGQTDADASAKTVQGVSPASS